MNEVKPTGTGGRINLLICLVRIVLAVIAIISLVLVVISNVYVFPALKSAELWQMAALCDVLLALSAAAFVASVTWKRSQIKSPEGTTKVFSGRYFSWLDRCPSILGFGDTTHEGHLSSFCDVLFSKRTAKVLRQMHGDQTRSDRAGRAGHHGRISHQLSNVERLDFQYRKVLGGLVLRSVYGGHPSTREVG